MAHRTEIGGVKPIRGTWLVLFYGDGRDKYYAPKDGHFNTAENWRIKIKELAEMGMEYLIFSGVVENGRAYYESDWMPHAYEGKESPVSAIMKTADECGMKVFMSCGWITNQLDCGVFCMDNPLNARILRELAQKFGKHKSFYGWYIPYEAGMGWYGMPYAMAPGYYGLAGLEDGIPRYNAFAAEARRLTPNAKILISPFGVDVANAPRPAEVCRAAFATRRGHHRLPGRSRMRSRGAARWICVGCLPNCGWRTTRCRGSNSGRTWNRLPGRWAARRTARSTSAWSPPPFHGSCRRWSP